MLSARGFITFFWILWLAKSAISQSLILQKLDDASSVDWGRMVIRTVGNSAAAASDRLQRIEALERAKLAAAENLLHALKRVSWRAGARISDAVEKNLLSESDLKSLAETFTIVDTRSLSDMSVEVDVELPLTGELLNLVLPSEIGKSPLRLSSAPLCPCCGQPWPAGRPLPEGLKLIIPSAGYTTAKGAPFTGAIIDARHLDLKPALLPKIVDENGEEIYSVEYVNRPAVEQNGLVAYRKTLDAATKDLRVGASPLMVRALKTAAANTDIVISNIDAALLHAAAKSQNFLNQCKVVIVF